MSTVTDLETKVQSLQDQIDAAKKSLQRAREEAAGVREGDIVTYIGKDGKKVPAKVASVKFYFSGKPWIGGYLKKADGEWSQVCRHLYGDWESL